MIEPTEQRPVESRRSKLSWVVNFTVSIAILSGCLFGYTLLGERKRPDRAKPAKSSVMVVNTQSLVEHEGPVRIQSNGVVVPLREIRLSTEVAGRIIEQSEHLRPGIMVEKGEVLIRLDPTEYEFEIRRLEAQVAQETAEIASVDVLIENTKQLLLLAEQQVEIVKSEQTRLDSLVQKRAASLSDVDILQRAELTAKSSLVEIGNRGRELLAQKELIIQKQAMTDVLLERAKLDLARCVVRSPIRGRVVTSSVEVESFVPEGTSFVTIEDTSEVEVRTNLTVDKMVWVSSSLAPRSANQSDSMSVSGRDAHLPPVPATISYQFGNDIHRWSATLMRIDGAGVDLQTRTYPCLFRVNTADTSDSLASPLRLTRGMFVAVSLETTPNRTLYRVSETAIRPGNRVWLNVDEKLRVIPVTIVSRLEDSVVVELSPGPNQQFSLNTASVIVSPISDPAEGMPVEEAPRLPRGNLSNSQQDLSSPDSNSNVQVTLKPLSNWCTESASWRTAILMLKRVLHEHTVERTALMEPQTVAHRGAGE